MKPNQLFRMAVVGVLWLSMGVGCRKEEPDIDAPVFPLVCNDGTCCLAQPGRSYYHVADVNGAEMNIRGGLSPGVHFKELQPQKFNTTLPVQNEKAYMKVMEICKLSLKNAGGVPLVPWDEPVTTFPYRVWGKIYNDPNFATWDAKPVNYLYIDRIEVIK
ncbi:hypothetical protein [Spirosoma montaniterrae]|uniref:Uncharacterized protein n=1 Tax=Spirosoma montaniterrae TaxID=1178516 RepID=A0A1P9WSB5_9BACT|nr:hypothetical protein [Spirosoma montaniterrae]AQG78233.1 hypothetical protein AWR27_02050 [Spirosoma montaniterrae]